MSSMILYKYNLIMSYNLNTKIQTIQNRQGTIMTYTKTKSGQRDKASSTEVYLNGDYCF